MRDDNFKNPLSGSQLPGSMPPQSLQPDEPLASLSRTTVEPHFQDDDEADQPSPTGGEAAPESSGPHTAVFSCPVDHSGTSVYLKGWLAENSEFPPIIFVHDLNEHIGKYRRVAIDLNTAGCNFYGFDLRGHGRSGRMLGHITSFDDLVNDLLQVVAWVKHREKSRPPIVIGQGIGALILAHFLSRYQRLVTAAVLCAPSFTLQQKVSGWQRFVIRTLSELLPTVRLPSAIKPHFGMGGSTSAKATMLEAIVSGKQPTSPLTAAFVNETLTAMEQGPKKLNDIQIPTLILYPSHDPICDHSALRQFNHGSEGRKNVAIVEIESSDHHLFMGDASGPNPQVREILWPWIQAFQIKRPT